MPVVRVNILFDSTPRTMAVDLPIDHLDDSMIQRMQKDFEDAVAFELAKMAQTASMTKEVHEQAWKEAEDEDYEVSDKDDDDDEYWRAPIQSKRDFFSRGFYNPPEADPTFVPAPPPCRRCRRSRRD